MFAPRRRRYLAAPGDVLHAPLLSFSASTSVREPLRPGLDLVNAVCVDLHTARSSASTSRIAVGSSASRVQYPRSKLGPEIFYAHGTRSSDALGVRYPRNNSTERRSMSQSSRGDMVASFSLFRCCCKGCFRLNLVIETRERENLQTQTRPTRAQRVRSDKYRAKTTESPIRDILNFRRFP